MSNLFVGFVEMRPKLIEIGYLCFERIPVLASYCDIG